MSAIPFHHPARQRGPAVLEGELTIPGAFPETMPGSSTPWTHLRTAMMSISMIFMLLPPAGSGAFAYAAVDLMVLVAATAIITRARQSGDRRQRLCGQRRDHLHYLSQIRQKAHGADRCAAVGGHPEPPCIGDPASGGSHCKCCGNGAGRTTASSKCPDGWRRSATRTASDNAIDETGGGMEPLRRNVLCRLMRAQEPVFGTAETTSLPPGHTRYVVRRKTQ